jgi:putative endonuclease
MGQRKKQCLIDENFDKLQELSECRNATHHKYNPDSKKIEE